MATFIAHRATGARKSDLDLTMRPLQHRGRSDIVFSWTQVSITHAVTPTVGNLVLFRALRNELLLFKLLLEELHVFVLEFRQRECVERFVLVRCSEVQIRSRYVALLLYLGVDRCRARANV